ncbi:MAG: hypothetical protein E7345_00135 [Clostridiales bacterium]|nr:hypothetical protein [Clostridiales bacterium]
MRKRTIKRLADTIFWYALYFLPVLILILMSLHNPITSLSSVISTLGLDILNDSVIYTTLNSVVGAGGILPLFSSPDILIFFTYYICVYILHLLVDIVIFIPKIAHKWLNTFTQGDE